MSTPRGAEHRDLEQRLRNLQAQINQLSSAVLRQRQLSVSSGDFVVSGGGGVLVKDGGTIEAEHDNGTAAVTFGDISTSFGSGQGMVLAGSDGNEHVILVELSSGTWRGYIGVDGFLHIEATDMQVGSTGDTATVSLDADDIYVTGNNTVTVDGASAGHAVLLGLVGQNVQIGHSTIGSAANCFISTAGRIYRSTSSLRYKANIEDAEVDPAKVLALRGRTWCDKADAEDPDAPRHIGFIAEELHEAGLGQFVVYDEDGPEAIQYDRLAVALLSVAQQQAEQIAGLSARLDALEKGA